MQPHGGVHREDLEIIEQSKDRYCKTLRISSQGWHEAAHDPWPYVNYLLYTLKRLYQEFEERYENTSLPMGEKTEAVRRAAAGFPGPFHVNELHKRCPEVSLAMVRKVLKDLSAEGTVECLGRGKQARWCTRCFSAFEARILLIRLLPRIRGLGVRVSPSAPAHRSQS